MSAWVDHQPDANGRPLPSITPVEVVLRSGETHRNRAGNLDNWRWRESGPDCVERYRVIAESELPHWLRPRQA